MQLKCRGQTLPTLRYWAYDELEEEYFKQMEHQVFCVI